MEALVAHMFKFVINPLTEISNKNVNTNDLIIDKYNKIKPKIANYNMIEPKIKDDTLYYKEF